jgi:hypothetical protein
MPSVSAAIEHFFEIFEANSNSQDVAAMVSQFADVFMAANPAGALAVRAGDFALALPRRKRLFDALGCRFTKLVSLDQTPLSERFTMAAAQWCMTFACSDGEERDVLAESIFIVDSGAEEPKIVFYLAKEDYIELLKSRGILAR